MNITLKLEVKMSWFHKIVDAVCYWAKADDDVRYGNPHALD